MTIFKRRTRRVFTQVELIETLKVAPVVDFEADEYRAIMRITLVNDEGVAQDYEIKMGLKQLHQLSNNLYLTCRAFNIPIGDSLADRAKGFWGMNP
jgi:hypothetical protein